MDGVRSVKAEKGISSVHYFIETRYILILDFHGQTVFDTSSSFSGISKIKTRWKQYLQEAQKLLQSSCKRYEIVFACMATTLLQKMYILI